MAWQDIALMAAGAIGGGVALIHGLLVRRLMAAPINSLFQAEPAISQPVKRLVPLLLDFSAYNWFLSGMALVAAAIWLGSEAKMMVGLLAGTSFLFAALGNFWGTKGRHMGWVPYAISTAVIFIALVG
jgi:hypothetical protein